MLRIPQGLIFCIFLIFLAARKEKTNGHGRLRTALFLDLL